MLRPLIRSDINLIRSDGHPDSFLDSAAQAPPQTRARLAADRTGAARLVAGDVQSLWTSELPLRQWTGTWAKAISRRQSAGWPAATRLCAERRPPTGRPVSRQLPHVAESARRDLRDQYGTPATTRGSRIGHDGPGTRRIRLCQ